MYSITITSTMLKWLDENMNKYSNLVSNPNLIRHFEGITTTNKSFDIKVYKTNLATISGPFKDRIYKQLLLNCLEENTIGMDEVGVGDFFGPVVYVSTTLTRDSINLLSELYLPIKDSKKLSDYEIKLVYNKIKDIVDYKVQITYDRDIDSNLNSVAQKCFYHNRNVSNLEFSCIIDLFTTEKAFFKYTKELNLNWPSSLILETKADSKYLSVAISSIIARAIFINEMNQLNKKYQMNFPYGANNVINTANIFVSRYSKDELKQFCKFSFKTFNELK